MTAAPFPRGRSILDDLPPPDALRPPVAADRAGSPVEGLAPYLGRVLARVRLACTLRSAWLARVWEEEVPDVANRGAADRGAPGEAAPALSGRGIADEAIAGRAIAGKEIAAVLAGLDSRHRELAWLVEAEKTSPALAGLRLELEAVEAAQARDDDSPLAQLTAVFGLPSAERDLVETALALELDPALGRVFAHLRGLAEGAEGAGPHVTEELTARLFGHPPGGLLTAASPARTWHLFAEREIAPAEPRALVLDPAVRDFLLGRTAGERGRGGSGSEVLDPVLRRASAPVPRLPPIDGWPVEGAARFLRELLEEGRGVCLVVSGPPGAGRKTFAAAVLAEVGLDALAVDADAGPAAPGSWHPELPRGEEEWEGAAPASEFIAGGEPGLFLRAQRHAFLHRVVPVWHGRQAAARLRSGRGGAVPPFPVQCVVLEGGEPLEAGRVWEELVPYRVELPVPSVAERGRLWRAYLPACGEWEEGEREELARRFRVTPGEIATAAARSPRGRGEGPAAISEAVRSGSRSRLGDLARRLPDGFRMDDLVVPEHVRTALEDFLYEARTRAELWEQPGIARLFPEGRGLAALFSGPPGTGKTMAAQVVAAELGLDIYRIDLSAVVSKYIGETTKNLGRVLGRAASMDAVLLFDEADSLFGRRTEVRDAHDRFANADTNYLLQAVEAYPGLAILSTNRKSCVDPAFLRRLRYVLEIPKPDAALREVLWRRMVAELAGAEAAEKGGLGGVLPVLAQTLDLTGAEIKHAVLAGVVAARREGEPLGLRHLARGIDRELAKEGRAISSRERARLEKAEREAASAGSRTGEGKS